MNARFRHLVALPRGEGRVALSWRLLAADADDEGFHVERNSGGSWEPVTEAPITDSTCFIDTAPLGECEYRVVDGDRQESEVVTVNSSAEATCVAKSIALDAGDRPALMVVGDLTNNGRLGFCVRMLRNGRIWIVAYDYDGRKLWERDTLLPAKGLWDGNTHHVPLVAWDINNDGRCEVVFHSAESDDLFPDGCYGEDGQGGTGELMTAVDGETGEVLWQVPWPGICARVMMTVGQLRGMDAPASIVVLDETYGPVNLTAIGGTDGTTEWSLVQERPGGHNLDIGDVDDDGCQEVICGGVCYRGDGTVMWEAEPFGHTDISKPMKIVPGLEGRQVFYAVESQNPGVYLVDKDGHTLWKEEYGHAHYGWIGRQNSGSGGLNPHVAEDGRREGMPQHFPIFGPGGEHVIELDDWQRKNFVPVHWDEGPETVFVIRKEDKRVVRLLPGGGIEDVPEGRVPESCLYGRNLVCVDITGDYRENILTYDEAAHAIVLLQNPLPAGRRGRSPWCSFDYRHDRSQTGSGYYIYAAPPITTV